MNQKRLLLAVFLVGFLFSTVYADHSAYLMFNNPSSYIGLWETIPSTAILTVTTDVGTPATQAIFYLTISHERHGPVASGESGTKNLNAGPSTQQFMSPQIIRWHELDYEADKGDSVYRSGRLPEGKYTAEIEIRDLQETLLAQTQASFTILYPEPPVLIVPSNGDQVVSKNPTFQWTPVILPPGHTITYVLKVVELLAGQTPEVAIDRNIVHHEARILGSTVLTYPIHALTLEVDKKYVWQVQALDENDLPAATVNGKSEIWTFNLTSQKVQLTAPTYVNDGPLSPDIDYTNSTTTLSANWTTVTGAAQYLYAIGTTSGGTDVVIWTDNGISTSFTKSGLSLKHKSMYYVSVKAKDSAGKESSVTISDGITVDISTPSSSITIDVPSGKISAQYMNKANFGLKWSGSDDASPFTYTIQYKYEKDLTWHTWLANTTVTLGTFTTTKDGTYYFRCQAKDAAGNEETPKTKAEDETTVDTKAPSSQVQPLTPKQTSLNFIVNWSGNDAAPGTGIEYYNIQVKVDNGSWQNWLTNQTSTSGEYTGQAGHKYAFQSQAVDRAGNVEAYPTQPDAKTEVPSPATTELSLIATAEPQHLNFYYNDQTATSDITLLFNGLSATTLKVSEAKLIWYDEYDAQIKTEAWPYSHLLNVSIKGGGTYVEYDFMLLASNSFLDSEIKALSQKASITKKDYSVDVIFKGIYVAADKNSYSLESSPLRLTISYFNKSKPTYKVNVTASPSNIYFSPLQQTNNIDVKVKMVGKKGDKLTFNKRIFKWYKSDPFSEYKTITESITPAFTLEDKTASAVATAELTQKISLSQDQTSQASFLGGKNQALYDLYIKYIGKDQEDNIIEAETETGLDVTFSSSSIALNVSVSPASILFSPTTPKNEITLTAQLNAPAGTTVKLDSLVAHWSKSDGSPYKKEKLALGSIISLSAGQSSTLKHGLTLKQESEAFYKVKVELRGKDDKGNPVSGTTTTPLTINYAASPVQMSVQVTPNEYIFDENNLQRYWTAKFSYTGKVAVKVDSFYVVWYEMGGTYYNRIGYKTLNTIEFKLPSGSPQQQIEQTISDYERVTTLNRPGSLKLASTTYPDKEERFGLIFEFIGKDALGRRVVVKSNKVSVKLREKTYPLEITSYPQTIKTSDDKFAIKYTLNSKINSPVNIDTRTTRIKKGAQVMPLTAYSKQLLGFKGTVTDEIIAFSSLLPETVPANGLYEHSTEISLNRSWILGSAESANCVADVTFDCKDGSGKTVQGRIYVPIIVGKPSQVKDSEEPPAMADKYILIPNVADIQALIGKTTVTSGSRVLNGPVRLILYPKPFDTLAVVVTAKNLTFSPHQTKKDTWEVKSGSFSEEVTGIGKELFSIYEKIIKIKKISYDHSRTNRLLVDKAEAHIPVIDKIVYMTNLIIDKNGLELKVSEQEMSAFGLTFRVTDIQQQSFSSGSLFSLNVHLRLKGKAKSEEFISTKLVVREVNKKTLVQMQAIPGKPVRVIPNTDYLNFKSFSFKDKGNDDYVLVVEVTSDNLPIFSKIGTITGMVEYEKSGKIKGKLELIKETTPGYTDDKTAIKLGSWGAIDLTYFVVQFAYKQTGSSGEPEYSQSYIGLAADLYLPLVGDPNNRIAIGDFKNPGITIDFNGKVTAKTITIADGKKLDLGPVFIKLISLGITPSPFAMAISGGLGVNMEGVVSGEIDIAGLKIDENGDFTNFNEVVKGGNLSILKVLSLGIDNVKYSDKPSTLNLVENSGASTDTTKKAGIKVDNYFQLKGANLNIGKSGSGGSGGFDDLLVYTATQNKKTNFILSRGKLSIQDAVDLRIDLKYIDTPQEKYLSVGGSATIVKKYAAAVYGKVGERGGDATWGFYLAVKGLDIPIGPVMLDEVGGGFFYRPSTQDINTVTNLANFKRIGITKEHSYKKPADSGPGVFAIFLAAGMYISDKNLMSGRAMMTLTENYWRIDAEAKALKDRAQALAFLNINWDLGYVEGKFQYSVDFILIKAEEGNNYFQFYAYDSSTWGVTGESDISLFFFIHTTSKFYIGSQGFMYDVVFEKSIDIGIIEGGTRYEVMAWWRKDVSWGAYASAKAWGEVLGGLIGAEIGVEGAFIGEPEYTLFAAGHLSVEVLWIEVFDGRVWITIGKDGFDGGTGGNTKYDKTIADARNTGKQMQSDMKKLAEDMRKAREGLYTLNDKQRAAAGNALVTLSGLGGYGNLALAFVKVGFMNLYDDDRKTGGSNSTLDDIDKFIWDKKANELVAKRQQLKSDSTDIASKIKQLQTKESQLNTLLNQKRELFEGKLPSLAELTKYGSPVGSTQFKTVTIEGKEKSVKVGYSFANTNATQLEKGIKQQKSDLDAHRQQLLKMVKDYIQKLNEVDKVLNGGSNSVSELSMDYASTFEQISNHSMNFLDYLHAHDRSASLKYSSLYLRKQEIRWAIREQTDRVGMKIPGTKAYLGTSALAVAALFI